MPSFKEKQFMARAVVGLLIAGLLINVRAAIRDRQLMSEYRARTPQCEESSFAPGGLVCTKELKRRDGPIKTFSFCGRKFEAALEYGEVLEDVNSRMEEDFAKYQMGRGGKKWRENYASLIEKYGEEQMKCLLVNYGWRPSVLQLRIYYASLNAKGRAQWAKGLPIDPHKHQLWRAAAPGLSFHGVGWAVDVENWEPAEAYFWEFKIPGGLHGLYADPYHFALGEFKRRGKAEAYLQQLWWEKKQLEEKLSQLNKLRKAMKYLPFL